MTSVSILLSKRKVLLAFMFSCALIVAFAFYLGRTAPGTIGRFFVILDLVLASAAGVVLAIKGFDKRPGLILNEEGIHRLGEFGFQPVIPWQRITRCSLAEEEGTFKVNTTLLLHVDDLKRAVAHLGVVDRWLLRSVIREHGTPYSIDIDDLKIDAPGLKVLVDNGIEAHRQRT